MKAAAPAVTRIALCVDDFGLHPGVNEATLRLAELGRVTTVSCMTGAPHWRAGAARLVATERIDIGLHLDLTEYPLTRGIRSSLPALAARAAAHTLDPARVGAEIHAQLEAFEDATGRRPAHVDGHQHIHQFPVVRDVLIAALLERYPNQRPWLRATRRPPAAGWKPWLIERLGARGLAELAQAFGYPQNRRLLGVYDFQGDASRFVTLLEQWLAVAITGDLLMCHAGLPSSAPDAIAAARQHEQEVIGGNAFPQLLERAGVVLAPLSELLADFGAISEPAGDHDGLRAPP